MGKRLTLKGFSPLMRGVGSKPLSFSNALTSKGTALVPSNIESSLLL
jgi:hypothetical protein